MRAAFFDLDRGLLRPPPLFDWGRRKEGSPVEQLRHRLRRQVRAIIAAHHWRGQVVVLVTDGTAEWAEMAARELDADGVLTPPQPRNALKAFRYGRAGDPVESNWRSAAVRQFCLRYNFAAGGSFGYGAQDEDWLWLEGLGHPAAAHPLRGLRRHAQTRGWPILNLDRRREWILPPTLGLGTAPPCVTLT